MQYMRQLKMIGNMNEGEILNGKNYYLALTLVESSCCSRTNMVISLGCFDNHQICFNSIHDLRQLSYIFDTLNLVLTQN